MIFRNHMMALVMLVSISQSIAFTQQDDHTPVRLSLLAKKFIVSEQATAFSIGVQNQSDQVLAAYDPKGQLRVALLQGRKGKTFTFDLPLDHPPTLLITDLDNDKQAEILVGTDQLRVFQIDNKGLTLQWTSQEREFDPSPAPKIAVADLDGDGHKEIIALNYGPDRSIENGAIHIFKGQINNREFTLTEEIELVDAQGYQSTSGIATGDFSGDGKTDIVIGNDNGFLWMFEKIDGKLKLKHHWSIEDGGAIGTGLAAGNVVGDETMELLVGTNGGNIFIYRFSGDKEPEVHATALAGRLSYGVQAKDIDGDGYDEFLLSRGSLGYASMTEEDVVVEIWKLDENDLINVWQKQTIGYKRPRLLLQDMDNDGSSDFLIYSLSEDGQSIDAFNPILK